MKPRRFEGPLAQPLCVTIEEAIELSRMTDDELREWMTREDKDWLIPVVYLSKPEFYRKYGIPDTTEGVEGEGWTEKS